MSPNSETSELVRWYIEWRLIDKAGVPKTSWKRTAKHLSGYPVKYLRLEWAQEVLSEAAANNPRHREFRVVEERTLVSQVVALCGQLTE